MPGGGARAGVLALVLCACAGATPPVKTTARRLTLEPASANASATALAPDALADRDPMARGVVTPFYGEIPDDRGGDGVAAAFERTLDSPADRFGDK